VATASHWLGTEVRSTVTIFISTENKTLVRRIMSPVMPPEPSCGGYTPRKYIPVEELAAQYNIVLPALEDLPKSYTSLRMWLNRRIAALNGRNNRLWQEVKADEAHLAYVQQQNRQRVLAYRVRKRATV
jgi:hypothetical protein